MASVFLSYDREDAGRARHFARALEQAGHEVWWDLHVRGGAQFSKVIEEALKAADAVVVLWSRHSVESAWVRDEAAAGRDSGRLIPVSLDDTEPPLGFRQFQTIDLSRWKGRGMPSQLHTLLADIESLATSREAPFARPTAPAAAVAPSWRNRHVLPVLPVLVALIVIVAAAAAYWFLAPRNSGPPTVAVAAADQAPLSQDMARNLLVKLSTLQGSAATNVRLLDAPARDQGADLRITVDAAERGGQIHANVALVSGREKTILWSKEFEQPATARSNVEESLAFAVARVLGCAIEEASGKHGRLSQELRRVYLNACATLAEVGWDNRTVLPQLRRVTVEAPRFRPAWALLLSAQSDYVSYLGALGQDSRPATAALKEYIDAARKLDPDMAEATLAELDLNPDLPITDTIALLDKAKAQDPHSPKVLIAHSGGMQRVGRMFDALDDAAQAAELDPLSPYTRTHLISVLLYSGQIERARAELARAKQLWPGTETIQQAEFAIELRAGDFEKAIRFEGQLWPGLPVYAAARRDPSDANVSRYLDYVRREGFDNSQLVFAVQALGEMNRADEFYALLESLSHHDVLREDSYVLFRPWVAPIRRDPRFMRLAKRLGLVSYWQKSGEWPDFCDDANLPFQCKVEAAKYE